MNTVYIIIIVTCASGKEAGVIARHLLEEHLVACANIMPGVKSRFWWKGKIESCNETIVFLKTKKKNFYAVEREVKRLHSYGVPEIVAIPILKGSHSYLKWIESECR